MVSTYNNAKNLKFVCITLDLHTSNLDLHRSREMYVGLAWTYIPLTPDYPYCFGQIPLTRCLFKLKQSINYYSETPCDALFDCDNFLLGLT